MGGLNCGGSLEGWTTVVHGRVEPPWFMGELVGTTYIAGTLWNGIAHKMQKKSYGASGIANFIVYMLSGGLADHSTHILPECKHLWFYKTALDHLTYSGKQLQHPLRDSSCVLQRDDGGTEREPAHSQDIGHRPGRLGQNCFLVFQVVIDPQLPLPLENL